jgi:hypothetical protein
MDRKRIAEEVIELLCAKLHNLPLPGDDPDFDYEATALVPEITDNELDIAEVGMDLEDAFGVTFVESSPGREGLETIGQIIDHIDQQLKSRN